MNHSKQVFDNKELTPSQAITCAVLDSSSPDNIYAYLQQRALAYHQIEEPKYDDLALETHLLHHESKLVQLALAQFGLNREVGNALFHSDDPAIKLAMLANATPMREAKSNPYGSCWVDQHIIQDVVHHGSEQSRKALFENDYFPTEEILLLIKKETHYHTLTEDKRQQLLKYFAKSKRLATPYDNTNWWQSKKAEKKYNALFHAIWKLALDVPPTKDWANVLIALFKNTELNSTISIEDTINHWPILDHEKKSIQGEPNLKVRWHLARLYIQQPEKFEDLQNANLWEKRMAYYSLFECEDPYFLSVYYAKDKVDFLEFAIDNPMLYRFSELREKLQEIIIKEKNETLINKFRIKTREVEKQMPHWFYENDEYWQTQNTFYQDTRKQIQKRGLEIAGVIIVCFLVLFVVLNLTSN